MTVATNDEFLSGIFGANATQALPWVCKFPGLPKHGPWTGARWAPGTGQTEAAGLNAYFTLAVYAPGTTGRQNGHCVAVRGLMLDDLNPTHLAWLDARLPPSIRIETSPGNFQVTYLFDAPQTDIQAVTRLHEQLIRLVGSDPAAKGAATRYGRLPFGANGKHSPPTPCRLDRCWPWVKYSPEAIAQGMGLDVSAALAPTAARVPPAEWGTLPDTAQGERVADLRSALAYVPADDRDVWVKMGHALKASLPDDPGFDLWAAWSNTSDKCDEDAEGLEWRWTGFDPSTTDYRAVFAEAARHGWQNPRSTAARDFSAVGFGVGVTLPSGASLTPLSASRPANDPSFKRVRIDDVAHAHIAPVRWLWDHYVPAGEVTLLSGHGGTGKSTLALMIAVAVAMGLPAFGVSTERARVLFFSAEDPGDVVRRNLRRACQHYGIDPGELHDWLTVLDATESDPTLASEGGAPTPAYAELAREIAAGRFGLVVIDNASDTYGGNEIDRRAVRRFMQSLAHPVRPHGGAVLLLAHVDKGTSRKQHAGQDESYSGSTAWHNSARSRLFLDRNSDGNLELHHQKSNRGPKRDLLTLAWPKDGLPTVVEPVRTSDAEATAGLIQALGAAIATGVRVSPAKNSTHYAGKVLKGFAGFPASLPSSKVSELIEAAQRSGAISKQTRHDASRKGYEVLALAA